MVQLRELFTCTSVLTLKSSIQYINCFGKTSITPNYSIPELEDFYKLDKESFAAIDEYFSLQIVTVFEYASGVNTNQKKLLFKHLLGCFFYPVLRSYRLFLANNHLETISYWDVKKLNADDLFYNTVDCKKKLQSNNYFLYKSVQFLKSCGEFLNVSSNNVDKAIELGRFGCN